MEAEEVMHKAEVYANFFGVEIPNEIDMRMNAARDGKYKEQLELERAAKQKRDAEILAESIAKDKKQLIKWRKGENVRLYSRHNDRDFLRIVENIDGTKKTKRIETTQGVFIPLEIGKKAYKFILDAIKNGGCDGGCKYLVLDFEVKSVTKDLVTIGCHKIEVKEIKSIAKKLNW